MIERAALWGTSDLRAARRAFAAGEPAAAQRLHDALRHLGTSARALGRGRLANAARRLARRLRERRRVETHRRLLARARALKLLSPEAAAGLDSSWERLSARTEREAARAAGKTLRRLERRLIRVAGRRLDAPAQRLQDARGRAREAVVSPPGASARGRDLVRYRRAVRACVDLTADLCRILDPTDDPRAPRERVALEALDRWHDVRRFRQRLARSRRKAERQGAVTLVSELNSFLAVLTQTELEARRRAIEASLFLSNVVPLPERAAAGG